MPAFELIALIVSIAIALGAIITFILAKPNIKNTTMIESKLAEQTLQLNNLLTRLDERDKINIELRNNDERLLKEQRSEQIELRAKFDQHQLENLKLIIDSLQKGMADIRKQIFEVLQSNTQTLSERLNKLTDETNLRLKEINNRVEQRLIESFEKTTATFTDVIKRLALIDEAQKKITELSGNMISLQEILADKRSRGAFGEVQLNSLVRNVLPENHFAFQYTLSNNKRADCILFLPEPTGNIVIDAKFPLESFQRLANFNLAEKERVAAKSDFRQDIKKHIQDISEKYIIDNETADCAVMFIPAEAVFAEIHANYPDLVELSHRHKTYMASPTTMMAILTTMRAVLKDAATRQQAHLIREHLMHLGQDFARFQKRMDNLAKHIDLAHTDVAEVYQVSKKITGRFDKIEQARLTNDEIKQLDEKDL
jgi:DNA recombination protein RmuC